MNHQEWVSKWLGKPIDYDKAYGAQCVDVARQYAADVHGVTNLEGVHGAVDFFVKHSSRPIQIANYFAIKYQEGMEIPQGALVVWGAIISNGNFGHIGICDSSTQLTLTVLDQDGFDNPQRDVKLGSVNGLRKRTVTYGNVLGYLVLRQDRNQTSSEIRILNKPPESWSASVTNRYPPADAKFALSDRTALLNDYWFNTVTKNYMLLTKSGWKNI